MRVMTKIVGQSSEYQCTIRLRDVEPVDKGKCQLVLARELTILRFIDLIGGESYTVESLEKVLQF